MSETPEYYELENDNYIDYGVQGYARPKLPHGVSFFGGKTITEEIPLLTFDVNFPAGSRLPHLLGDVIPIVSDYFITILRKAGVENFQAFPVLLQNPETGESWKNYFAFNVIGVVRAADRELSEYDVIMEGNETIPPLLAFHKVVLQRKKLNGLAMFRMAENNSIIIHRDILQCFADNKPEGNWGMQVIEISLSD